MSVKIEIAPEMTLAQLVQSKMSGYMVEETPHIGNLAISSLSLLSLGMQPKLIDATVGEKDNLFYPHCIIQDGARTQIAPANLMTSHNKVTNASMSLTQFHTQPLADMGLQVLSHNQWLAERTDLAYKTIAATMNDRSIAIWKRYVNLDGLVTIIPAQSCSQVLGRIHKVTVAGDESGWVIPNPVNVLLDLVIGAVETEKAVVYMLSGQSMYKYIQKGYDRFGPMNALISDMYDSVRGQVIKNLPESLLVKMVPTTALRHFVAPRQLTTQLDTKLRYYEKLKKASARCGRKISEQCLSAKKVVNFRKKRESLFQNLSQSIAHVCAESETGMFYSQHDLYKNQDTVYIPDHVLDMPFKEMMAIAQKMNALSK